MSGTAFARKKEDDAAKMREKQAKGEFDFIANRIASGVP